MTSARFRKLEFFVTTETYAGLEAIAGEAEKTVLELADELLEAIVEDDAAAHAEICEPAE